jgi:hypothetical protein
MVYSIYYLLHEINRINNIEHVHKLKKNVQKFIDSACIYEKKLFINIRPRATLTEL